MSKQTDLQRAIDSLEAEKVVIQHAIDKLKMVQIAKAMQKSKPARVSTLKTRLRGQREPTAREAAQFDNLPE